MSSVAPTGALVHSRPQWLRLAGERVTPAQVLVTVGLGAMVGAVALPAKVSPLDVGLMVAAVVGLVFATRHPIWCVAGVVGLTIFGGYRASLPLGLVDARLTDVPLALLIVWVVHLRIQDGRLARNDLGQRPLALLLMAFGLSLLASYRAAEDGFVDLLVSLVRVVTTFSLVWLVPYAVRTARHRLFVLRSIVLAGTAELAWSGFVFVRDGRFPDRFRGLNGPNAEGLVAGLVLIAVINLPLFRLRTRIAIGVLATACLVQSKSIASIAAVMMVLGFFGLRAARARNPRTEALLRPARFLILVAGAVLLVSNVRPGDLPNQRFFESSSTASRMTLAYAGTRIFADHPMLGVGWQRSSSGDVIGSQDVVEAVQNRFSTVRADLLPQGQAISVHNAYIQILAESGILGMVILLAAFVLGRRGVRAVVARAGPEAPLARTVVSMLVLVLVWWNDNPIYGAQPETVFFAILLGLLASIPLVPEARHHQARDGEAIIPVPASRG